VHHHPYVGRDQERRSEEEIVEALGVAISVNAGAALVYSSRVLDAFHAKTDEGGAA
jgi:hypothetical protein